MIVHRDLKPAKILLTADGRPKITDFGLARRLGDDSDQTRTGTIVGTPVYMAPEQTRGEDHDFGPLVDQHALGAILYEMLTGCPPFWGSTPSDTIEQVRTQEPVPPTQLQPKVPRDLDMTNSITLPDRTTRDGTDFEPTHSCVPRVEPSHSARKQIRPEGRDRRLPSQSTGRTSRDRHLSRSRRSNNYDAE
jgi:serine/threonine protein kinase